MWLIFESAMQTRRVWSQRLVPRARGKVFYPGKKTLKGRRMVSQNHWNAGWKGLLEIRSSAPGGTMPVEGICSGFSLPGWRSTAFLGGVPSLLCDKDLPSIQPELPQGQPVATAPATLPALPRTARLQHPLIAPDVAAGAVKLPLGLLFARLNKPSSLSPP